jgi:hypothetical protein
MRTIKRIDPQDADYYIQLTKSEWNWHDRVVGFTLTPDEDEQRAKEGWEIVTYYSEGLLDPTGSIKKPEWVYVLVNKSVPGICKIGMTSTSVTQRCKEINSATGVITPWFPVFKYKCLNSYLLEQSVHQKLEEFGYRVSKNREGFEINSNLAIEIIKQQGEKLTVRQQDFNNKF